MNNLEKKLPVAISKQNFVKLYFKELGESFLIEEINKIILENRKSKIKRFEHYTDHRLKRSKLIYQYELIIFAKIYGLPNGYCFPRIIERN